MVNHLSTEKEDEYPKNSAENTPIETNPAYVIIT